MANAFDRLGMRPCLVLSQDMLRESFRAAGKEAHPDGGSAEGEFTALNEAFSTLSSPARRLRHWLEIRGLTVETRGTIDTALMDLFSQVGTTTQRAESIIRRRDEANSALVRAMLEPETQICREELEAAIGTVETWITRECGIFPELEKSETPNLETASEIARNLVFLEKWRAGLRACYSRLA